MNIKRKSVLWLVSFGLPLAYPAATQYDFDVCRCEYPNEAIYPARDENSGSPFVIVGDVLILPSFHEACTNVSFICPGTEHSGAVPWSYDCDKLREDARDRRQLRGVQLLEGQRSLFDGINDGADHTRHSLPHSLHNLLDKSLTDGYEYIELPANGEYCRHTGEGVRAAPHTCQTSVTIDFEKAGNGRPLHGGEFVKNEWLPTLGVKISATDHDGSPNVHAMIFDSSQPLENNLDGSEVLHLGTPNESCLGPGVGSGGEVGRAGENCRSLQNLLLPVKKSGSEFQPGGMIMFEFNRGIVLYSVTLLNIDGERSQLHVLQGDGTNSIIKADPAGKNGLTTTRLDIENVARVTFSLEMMGAVASLDLCI